MMTLLSTRKSCNACLARQPNLSPQTHISFGNTLSESVEQTAFCKANISLNAPRKAYNFPFPMLNATTNPEKKLITVASACKCGNARARSIHTHDVWNVKTSVFMVKAVKNYSLFMFIFDGEWRMANGERQT